MTATDAAAGVTIGTLTDLDDGTYTVGPLPPGSYVLSVEAAAGLVDPFDFSAPNAGKFKTDVLTHFSGGNANPAPLQILAGSDLTADLTVGSRGPDAASRLPWYRRTRNRGQLSRRDRPGGRLACRR